MFDWAKTLAGRGLTAPGFPNEFGATATPGPTWPHFETLGFGDLSLLVKFGVQSGCGAARSSSWGRGVTTSAI